MLPSSQAGWCGLPELGPGSTEDLRSTLCSVSISDYDAYIPAGAGRPDHHTVGITSELRSKRFWGLVFRHSDESATESKVRGTVYANVLLPVTSDGLARLPTLSSEW